MSQDEQPQKNSQKPASEPDPETAQTNMDATSTTTHTSHTHHNIHRKHTHAHNIQALDIRKTLQTATWYTVRYNTQYIINTLNAVLHNCQDVYAEWKMFLYNEMLIQHNIYVCVLI